MTCNRLIRIACAAGTMAVCLAFIPTAIADPSSYTIEDWNFIKMLAEEDMLPQTGNSADVDVLITKAKAVCDFHDDPNDIGDFNDLMDALFPNAQGAYTLKFAVYAKRAYCLPES